MSFNQSTAQSRTLTEGLDSRGHDLDGLTLAAAFRKHLIEDDEIIAIAQRSSETRRSHSAVFAEGQFPGPYVDFHWPLHVSAESIAYAFVSSPLVLFDEPLPKPSELETAASELLADRFAGLIGRLARGELVAVGTFAATGVEGPLGSGQWLRTDLTVDVKNSAVCEIRDHGAVPIWTGVCLRLADQHPQDHQKVLSQPNAEQPTKARKQIQTKSNCRDQCIDWLMSVMSAPAGTPLTNDELWAEASASWPGKLSKRAFGRCRALVLGRLSEDQRWRWERPGPKRKRS